MVPALLALAEVRTLLSAFRCIIYWWWECFLQGTSRTIRG